MKRMNWTSPLLWTTLSLAFLLLTLTPAPALAGPGVVLYEVTEDMYLKDAAGNVVSDLGLATRRTAVAQLSGWAAVGTPFCPYVVLALDPTATRCVLNATGADDVSLATGKGTLAGTFTVVIQGDNLIDASEFVVMTGTFRGDADLSRAMSGAAPLGSITNGVVTIDGQVGLQLPFNGTFRLPFMVTSTSGRTKAKRDTNAYYLLDDGTLQAVQTNERSLGVPTVRIEIYF